MDYIYKKIYWIIGLIGGIPLLKWLLWGRVRKYLKSKKTRKTIEFFINNVSNHADEIIDIIQTEDEITGKELRKQLILTCKTTIKKLKENDGVN